MTVSATLPGTAEGATLLAVSFEVENQKASHDMFIRINGQTNRLTGINHTYANGNTQFNYLVTMKEDGTVFIRMGKGHYILKNFARTISEDEMMTLAFHLKKVSESR